jgi:peptidoglycan/LPS O-acetylase OafA/YrhL
MILQSHLFTMVFYAFFVALVMSLLRRDEKKARIKYGLTLFLVMVAGAIAFGWFMYLFI